MVEWTRISDRRRSAGHLVLAAWTMICCAGCHSFGSWRLDTESPHEWDQIVSAEPVPLATSRPTVDLVSQPASPADVQSAAGRWSLTLNEAIAFALVQNRDLQIERTVPLEVRQSVVLEDSVFDPLLQVGGGWQRSDNQITNIVQGPGGPVTATATDLFGAPQGLTDQLRVSKRTRTGGQVAASFGTSYLLSEPSGAFLLLNPEIRSTLRFQVDQPLFRGAGRPVNTIDVRIARQSHHAAVHQLEIQVRATVLATVSAYWSLYGAVAELVSLDEAVEQADVTWRQEQEKQTLGESARPDVAEARAQLERFRADQIAARKRVADAERSLRDLLGIPHEDGRRVIPVTVPHAAEPQLNWEAAVVDAGMVRPEIAMRQTAVRRAQLNVDRACNNLRPDIRAYAGYAVTGAAGRFDDSVNTIADNDFTTWWAGFVYERPLDRRFDHASQQQAQLALRREIHGMQRVRQQIQSELHEAWQAVTSSWEIIQRQQDRQAAAAELLEARRAMFEVGELSLDVYLRATAEWSQSLSEERAAVSAYNVALARWDHARGMILDSYNVRVQSMDSEAVADTEFLSRYLQPPDSKSME